MNLINDDSIRDKNSTIAEAAQVSRLLSGRILA